MSSAEHEEYLKAFTNLANEIIASKEKSTQLLIDAGIYDHDGNLTENYRFE